MPFTSLGLNLHQAYLDFSYVRPSEQNRLDFVLFVNKKTVSCLLTPESYKAQKGAAFTCSTFAKPKLL